MFVGEVNVFINDSTQEMILHWKADLTTRANEKHQHTAMNVSLFTFPDESPKDN